MSGAVVLFRKNSQSDNLTLCKWLQFLYISNSNWSIILFLTFQCIRYLLGHFSPFFCKQGKWLHPFKRFFFKWLHPPSVSSSSDFIHQASLLSSLTILSILFPSLLELLQCSFTYSLFLNIACLHKWLMSTLALSCNM